jgi:hypothetical protein
MVTRPETNNHWQLRRLELHCRQKGLKAKPQKRLQGVVATQQQLSYSQLINNSKEEVLYNLWVICGSAVGDLPSSHMMDFYPSIYPESTLQGMHSNQLSNEVQKLVNTNISDHLFARYKKSMVQPPKQAKAPPK